jgi:hypothetical protein
VKAMKHLSDSFNLAQDFYNQAQTGACSTGLSVAMECAAESAAHFTQPAASKATYCNAFSMHRNSSQVRAWGQSSSRASFKTFQKVSAAAVKPNHPHHPGQLSLPAGRHTHVSVEDEDRMVKVVLLMQDMTMPTESHALNRVFEGMLARGSYAHWFPKGRTDSWCNRFLQCPSDCFHRSTSKLELAHERWATVTEPKSHTRPRSRQNSGISQLLERFSQSTLKIAPGGSPRLIPGQKGQDATRGKDI